MNAEACSILLYNKKTNKLEFRLALNEDTTKSKVLQDKVGLDMGQGIAGWVAQNLKPVLVEDAQKDPRFHKSMDEITS
ncbi:MAG: cyclic nucleotide-binding protein, partial [Candidatus Latescibacteria bacterium]|nr:cyclic nucleotide-binding protein [Candidatus Latescibacterota bacterium]